MRLGILGLLATLLFMHSPGRAQQGEPEEAALEEARRLFYASVENRKQIEPAVAAFKEIIRIRPDWEGRALTYIGALTALKGKHSFLPHDKWRWANRGLKIMDRGVALSPDDVEALFIHSSTCYFLPFFFKRSQDAQNKFRALVRLLPERHAEYDQQMVKNVVLFIAERADLDEGERTALERLRDALNIGVSGNDQTPAADGKKS